MVDVLAIGPHPDDMELSAGGTLALLTSEGKSVALADLTAGESATRGTPEIRRGESLKAAEVLGATSRDCLGLPDGGLLSTDRAQLEAVVACIRNHKPRIVITVSDLDDHPDHMEGSRLVQRGVYLAGLMNWPRSGKQSARPRRILLAMGRGVFVPDLVVDITKTASVKQQALAAYASQFRVSKTEPWTPISDPAFLPRIEGRDRHYGGLVGADYGEPFLVPGPWAVRTGAELFEGTA